MRSSVPPRSSPSQENRWHRLKGRRLADTGGRHLLDDEQARRSRTTDAPTPATEPAHAIARPEVHDERCRLRTFSSTWPSAEVPLSSGLEGSTAMMFWAAREPSSETSPARARLWT